MRNEVKFEVSHIWDRKESKKEKLSAEEIPIIVHMYELVLAKTRYFAKIRDWYSWNKSCQMPCKVRCTGWALFIPCMLWSEC